MPIQNRGRASRVLALALALYLSDVLSDVLGLMLAAAFMAFINP